MNNLVREYLIRKAQAKKTVTYSELIRDCRLDLDMSNPADRNEIAHILAEISIYEFQENGVLLSAIVLLQGGNQPGDGFFTLAEELGIFNSSIDRITFWSQQCDTVFSSY